MKKVSFVILVFCFITCSTKENDSDPYFYPDELDYMPEMVAPGIISKASFEGHASITPKGDEIYFAIYNNDHTYSTIVYSALEEGKWKEPEIASFSGKFRDGSPALSPDGNRLYFSSNRPLQGNSPISGNDIWYTERSESGAWGTPVRLNDQINTEYNEFSPSVDQEGNLYFCSNRPEGFGDMDVYVAEYENGVYRSPELLSDSINSIYHEGNVGVSPNGKLLFVMIQHKPGDYGYDDIHYAQKLANGWSGVKNLGPIINTPTYDFSPKVSPDGKTLYFSSRINRNYNRTGTAYTFEEFLNYLNSPLNGFGNIFRIPIDSLELE